MRKGSDEGYSAGRCLCDDVKADSAFDEQSQVFTMPDLGSIGRQESAKNAEHLGSDEAGS